MAITGKLKPLKVERVKKPGRYGDGGNLFLYVSPSGAKSWVFKYMINGRRREMGLGAKSEVDLHGARDLATHYRKLVRNKIDPLEKRKQEQAADKGNTVNFTAAAKACIRAKQSEWRSPKTPDQWRNSLRDYAEPVFGHIPVSQIDLATVLKCLQPIWETKTETASRVRGRVETVLDWATVKGFREGDNPARWKGNLDQLLGKPSKVAPVQHFAALPYEEMPAFIAKLQQRTGIAPPAVLFTILTAARSGEVRGATWDEVDLKSAIWTIPKDRMKAGRDHRVLLSSAAMKVLGKMQPLQHDDYIFPGLKQSRPLSDQALTKTLRRMAITEEQASIHGFRSTFRDWVAEKTNYPSEVAEMALAHKVSNQVEAAYRRGDLLEKRRKLMESWAHYCFAKSADVVSLISERNAAHEK